MRNHYLFDGQSGGTLIVIECSTPNQVTLRFRLKFVRAETPQLRVA